MAKEGEYLYGVTGMSEGKSFGPIGIGERGDEVYIVPYQNIAAVISNSPIIDYKSLTRDVVARYLIAHQTAIEQVMKQHTIIPFKFGTMVENTEELKAIMARGYPKFTCALREMQGKIELDIIALWNKDIIFQDIAGEPEVKQIREAIGQNASDQNKIELGRMVAASLNKRKLEFAQEILCKFDRFAEDICVHEVMSDGMIANSSLLIRKDNEKRLDSEISELDRKYEGRVNFRCVGPLPPYSFSVIEVKKIGFDTVEEARSELELPQEATLNEIKPAFRRLAKEYHPDKNPNPDAQSKFQAIQEAYDVLAEYCQDGKCSFKKEDFEDSFVIRMLRVENGAYKPQGIKS